MNILPNLLALLPVTLPAASPLVVAWTLLGLWLGGSVLVVTLWGLAGSLVDRRRT